MTMQPRTRARVAALSALVVLSAVGCGAGAGPAQPPTTDTSSTDVADDADVDPEVDAAQEDADVDAVQEDADVDAAHEDDDVAEGTESSANRMHGDAGEDASQQLPPVDMEARSACSEAHPEIRDRSSPQRTAGRLADAAECMEDAGAIGLAIRLGDAVLREFPSSPEAQTMLLELARLYHRIDQKHLAAERYEAYGRRYPGADDAYEALANAVCLRRALGDEDGAAEDLTFMRKNYGRKRDVEVSCPRAAD